MCVCRFGWSVGIIVLVCVTPPNSNCCNTYIYVHIEHCVGWSVGINIIVLCMTQIYVLQQFGGVNMCGHKDMCCNFGSWNFAFEHLAFEHFALAFGWLAFGIWNLAFGLCLFWLLAFGSWLSDFWLLAF